MALFETGDLSGNLSSRTKATSAYICLTLERMNQNRVNEAAADISVEFVGNRLCYMNL